MTAKYLQETIKVVTGSHDRTLKMWDLRSIACIETKSAGSSCNDLVTTDSLGSTIIRGHYDKKIRFWDIRTEKQADDILMPAKITSIDLSKDGNCLICSIRVDTIKLLDLRKNQIVSSFSHENFKLSCDWARASFNSCGSKVACGSSDDFVYIWNVLGEFEATLKSHTCNDLVTTDSLGSTIISGHYDKKIRFWNIRTEKQAEDILMPAKITSIDFSKDGNCLICSIRDDTIKLSDLRKNQIVSSFS
ncbi:autophagy-related protein 16-1-like [Eurosta solidaginis]|uniref:autophagy-related protein 16-1-like n=1 Tax=Eurosta solidaginis TaxID=178769 RepID=UPI003530D432